MFFRVPQLLAATTAPGTQQTTISFRAYTAEFGETLLFLLAGVILFWLAYGRRLLMWSPPRVTTKGGAGVLSLVGGVMVWCFLAMPMASMAYLQRGTTRPLSDAQQVSVYAITCVVGLLTATALHAFLRRAKTTDMIGLTPLRMTWQPGKAIVAAMIAVPFTYFIATACLLAYQLLHIEHEQAHQMLQVMERNESHRWTLWITILNATLLAPLFEEVLFRGHVQTILTATFPRSRMTAIVVTSILWAAIHEPWTAPAIFALGIAIGLAYEWSGSLLVAIAIHVAFNAISTASFLWER